jgi:hypothetical protein
MIGLGFYNALNTTLDINGPFIRFTDQPESATANSGGSVTISATAVAEFKHNPTIPGERVTNTGEFKYQWYIDDVAAEDIADRISGSQTNEITISRLLSPDDSGKSVFVRATYEGSAYQSEAGAITAGIARSTGNNVNSQIESASAIITVNPLINITTQPVSATVDQDANATFTVVADASDGTDVSYQWQRDGSPLSDGDTVSGSNTPTLTISDAEGGTSNISVVISHPTAGNSPVQSSVVIFDVLFSKKTIYYVDQNEGGTVYDSGEHNLVDSSLTFNAVADEPARMYTIYCRNEDVTMKVTMAGGAGESYSDKLGGEGGKSEFIITLEKDQEYTFKLMPFGGKGSVTTGGGGAFLYKQARLLVAIGGGGSAYGYPGGDGGGIGYAGETSKDGKSAGGTTPPEGELLTFGTFPSNGNGGRVSACITGSSYFENLYSRCEGYGLSRYRNFNGTEITKTPSLHRGFKSGVAHRNNGGIGLAGGGSGTVGGAAKSSSAGGASGYSSGEVTVLSSEVGGNTSTLSYVTFENYDGFIPDPNEILLRVSHADGTIENVSNESDFEFRNGDILYPTNADYEIEIKCAGRKPLTDPINAGGNGAFVQGTLTLKAGAAYYIRSNRVGALFYDSREDKDKIIMIGAEGGYQSYWSARGGDAGFPSGSSGDDKSLSKGGDGATTNGYRSGSGGRGGYGFGEADLTAGDGGSGGFYKAGSGGWGRDGSGGSGGLGYYGGGGGGGGWDYNRNFGGRFGGGGGGGSSYGGGIPSGTPYAPEHIVTDVTYGANSFNNASVTLISVLGFTAVE